MLVYSQINSAYLEELKLAELYWIVKVLLVNFAVPLRLLLSRGSVDPGWKARGCLKQEQLVLSHL